jgi:hypothetical protein
VHVQLAVHEGAKFAAGEVIPSINGVQIQIRRNEVQGFEFSADNGSVGSSHIDSLSGSKVQKSLWDTRGKEQEVISWIGDVDERSVISRAIEQREIVGNELSEEGGKDGEVLFVHQSSFVSHDFSCNVSLDGSVGHHLKNSIGILITFYSSAVELSESASQRIGNVVASSIQEASVGRATLSKDGANTNY